MVGHKHSHSTSYNRPSLKEFLASIATIRGDLSNITAPPFILAEHSTVELPQYWGDHPDLFVAPALARTPQERALAVLKWFLGSLRNQLYAGRKPDEGIKKPLNAFLGELFLGGWTDEQHGETKLVSEQVSHHPPVTACYLYNNKYGIRAQGFTCQEIRLSSSVMIRQKGYAILHIHEWDEDYLIPVPNIKIKGIWGGMPYPEIGGTYHIASSSGFVSEVHFGEKGWISGGTKNGVEARVYNTEQPVVDVYTVSGAWTSTFTARDAGTGEEIETYDVEAAKWYRIEVPDIADQDTWESRRAWSGVRDALRRGDMRATAEEKLIVENGQRRMRKEESTRGDKWRTLFFQPVSEDPIFEKLSRMVPKDADYGTTRQIWKVDEDAIAKTARPYRGTLSPTGEQHEVVGGGEVQPAEVLSEKENVGLDGGADGHVRQTLGRMHSGSVMLR